MKAHGFEGIPPDVAKSWIRIHPPEEPLGPDYLTIHQLIGLWQVPLGVGRRIIREQLAAGKIASARRTVRGRGGVTTFYRLLT